MLSKTAVRSAANASPICLVQSTCASHRAHDVGKQHQRDVAGVEAGLRRRILQGRALFGLVAGEPLVERRDLAGIGRTEQHLREQLVRIEGDRREQAIE